MCAFKKKMITAIVNIELYRYEIHSLLKAFYPKEEVKVLTALDAAENRKYRQIAMNPFLYVDFEESGVSVTFCDGGGSHTAAAPEGVSFAGKNPALKTALKHLLYTLLAEREGRVLPWGS